MAWSAANRLGRRLRLLRTRWTSLEGDWTPEKLSHFLENPGDYAPGTKMTFAGLNKVEDRADIIAYLQRRTAERPRRANLPPSPGSFTHSCLRARVRRAT